MPASMYLVNPASDFVTYFSAEVLAGSGLPGAILGDLPTTTLAALAPPDFDITICDEHIAPVDYDHPADWIGITGKVNQRQRMTAIADEFRRRGKRVVMGGPYASLSPEALRPHCDVLVRGEVEEISAELFGDLRAGTPREEYLGGRPDLAHSPVPRWDLYANERALHGAVQTSRGCPFECEFCDVIQYVGRKQRHKPVALVLAELDALYAHSYPAIFLADDNFTVYRRRAKELLEGIARWRRDHRVNFITQVSIDAARDEELLHMCVDAGLTEVFIGIETPNEESLREAKKRQNLQGNLADQVRKFVEHGLAVMGGMVVGFDSDGPDIFERQYEFAMSIPVPIFSVGALVAPEATPLYDRIARVGRLVRGGSETQAVPWRSNIQPLNMSPDEMRIGMQRLCNALYAPAAFGERMLRFIECFGRASRNGLPPAVDPATMRPVDVQAIQLGLGVRRMGPEEGRMFHRVWAAASRRPVTVPFVSRMLFTYAQIRHMFEQGGFWNPRLADSPSASSPA
jgi:radical SAM superfamily enzyme YgiQ (UPF0313 family)